MKNPLENFGCMVFGNRAMRERLPRDVYKRLRKTIEEGKTLDPSIADVVANALKDWSIEKGVTHFTHWFQPMTGITAEKHDSFIAQAKDGGVIMEFSGKELIQGEPDASSFPSGGLRATFEARGYTAWDPTSDAFIKEGTLCIPTAFCSYSGEALDKKTPLLRSMESFNKEALRVLRLIGNTEIKRVITTVGPEQEYFLVDKKMYEKRPDLRFCGRTLVGAKPPKGQELEDHYFGALKPRVRAFMQDFNQELWNLGILAKTEHNEVAPAQHELAPIYSTTNIATDHNQLTMEIIKKVADRHGMVCLLHEKPFAGVNGSGKHNNWSIAADSGENLLDPGDDPAKNQRFLLFLAAVIAAVDDYQDMLRVSVASAGNDHRLGANEAPPAIVSIFLGDEITAVVEALAKGKSVDAIKKQQLHAGVDTLPDFAKDNTDRNRTSPFAFTGNKFEFRMVGSAFSIAGPNFILNTIVAEELSRFADRLEEGESADKIIASTLAAHLRIIFNGNNYAAEWVDEAEKRGLLNLITTVDTLPYFISPKNIELFGRHGILTEAEIRSRYEILMDTYCRTINIEALTMLELIRRYIVPAACAYSRALADGVGAKLAVAAGLPCLAEKELIGKISSLIDDMHQKAALLEKILAAVPNHGTDIKVAATYYRDQVIAAMNDLRAVADETEPLVGQDYWPLPTYGDLLFSV